PGRTPHLGRWSAVGLGEAGIEAAEARKAGRERDLGHTQRRFVEQPLRELDPASSRQSARRRAEVLHEEAIELTWAESESGGKVSAAALIQEAAIDQPQAASDDRGRCLPGR